MNLSSQPKIELISLTCPVEYDIRTSNAWHGNISGLKAEKLLRGQKVPYLYILREGEHEGDFYATYVRPDFSVAHVPFNISLTDTGWYYENGSYCSLSDNSSLSDVLHLIMHCKKGQGLPFSLTS